MLTNRTPPKSQPRGMGYSNNEDPGVNEPDDLQSPSLGTYPDTKDFIAQFMKTPEEPNPTYPLPPQQMAPQIQQQQPMPNFVTGANSGGSSLPNGMIMVPANQMMMLAPQWMFPQSQGPGGSSSPHPPSLPPTPEPPPTPEILQEAPVSDYKGLGGPDSVPFRMTKHDGGPALQKKTLIDELFISPSGDTRQRSFRTTLNLEIAQTKSRLKWSVLFHYVLGFILLAKLLPDALDRFGIFVLEIEELLIPKAKLWELFWITSILVTFLGLASCKKSNLGLMTKFFYGILVFGLLPVLMGFFVNFGDVYTYASTKDLEQVETWNGLPVGVLWYVYLFMSLQAHLFELYFAKTLIKTWQPRTKKTQ